MFSCKVVAPFVGFSQKDLSKLENVPFRLKFKNIKLLKTQSEVGRYHFGSLIFGFILMFLLCQAPLKRFCESVTSPKNGPTTDRLKLIQDMLKNWFCNQ